VHIAVVAETFGVKIKWPDPSTADKLPPVVQLADVIITLPAGVAPVSRPELLETAGVVGAPATPVMRNCVFPTPV
jgi:hypothetical protein